MRCAYVAEVLYSVTPKPYAKETGPQNSTTIIAKHELSNVG